VPAATCASPWLPACGPAVLDDLGLDAALSGIAARSAVPVRLTVELDRRPPVAVETVAYVVVSEALSNVARHAAAVRVVIAEDSILLRDGLCRLFASRDVEVVAAVGDAPALLTAVEQHRPDLLIADVRMPPGFTDEGLRAALSVSVRWPDVGVLVLSQYVEERYAAKLLAERTSRIGYLLKDRIADVDEFVDAARRIAGGGTALDPEVVSQLLVRRRADPLERLTPRERDVLALMAEGRSNAGIAAALVVTDSAVAKHVNSIFTKLDRAPADSDHRRVLAVLRYLRAVP
jgi:DNA-binding NarL/FixJ family response regulator